MKDLGIPESMQQNKYDDRINSPKRSHPRTSLVLNTWSSADSVRFKLWTVAQICAKQAPKKEVLVDFLPGTEWNWNSWRNVKFEKEPWHVARAKTPTLGGPHFQLETPDLC